MCLSNVYLFENGEEKLVCEYVSNIDTDSGEITLTDVLGQEITVTGRLAKVDLVKNIILITKEG